MIIFCERLIHPTPAEWEQVRPIYEDNFPPEQRVPLHLIVKDVEAGELLLLVARLDQAIVGFALVSRLRSVPVMYLPYYAVDQRWQGQGVGSGLFRYMVDFLARSTGTTALIWEVEPDNPDDPADLRRRRIRFYERLGADVIDMAASYCMPNMAGDGIVPLGLMWIPLKDRSRVLTKDEVIGWVADIYQNDYPDHPELAARIIADIRRWPG